MKHQVLEKDQSKKKNDFRDEKNQQTKQDYTSTSLKIALLLLLAVIAEDELEDISEKLKRLFIHFT